VNPTPPHRSHYLKRSSAPFENKGDNSKQTGPYGQWKGFLRLSLVTCPIPLIPANAAEEVTEGGLDGIAPESARTIDIDEFVPRTEIDPLYILRPYYLVPDGKVGHDAFAVIRETIRATGKVAIRRVVLTNREREIALDARDEGMVGMLLRYSNEVRSPAQYFGTIQDVKIAKDMLDLSKHIVEEMSGHFEPFDPDKFFEPDEFENKSAANEKKGSNVINLMDALKKSAAKGKQKERRAAIKK
jgi:DNA end-binding protein Ku